MSESKEGEKTPEGKILDEEPPCRVPEGGYVLRRHASGSWWIRYMQNGKMHDGSLGTADREEAKRRAKVLFCKPSSAEKPIWWLPPVGARVEAFEVGRTTNGVEVRREAETTTFITDLHRVAPRSVEVEATAAVGGRVGGAGGPAAYGGGTGTVTFMSYGGIGGGGGGSGVPLRERIDTQLIRQGGGWSTFKRDGEWWAERIDGKRRVSFCLSTADDAIAGQRFAALQNDFRETPLDELLSATFARRYDWVHASGYRWQPVYEDGTPAEPIHKAINKADKRLHELAAPTQEERADDAREVIDGLERVEAAASTWLGVPIESGAVCGLLRLRPALGGEWSVIIESYREPGDRDAVVVEGPRDQIDALTRSWIASIAALMPPMITVKA